MSASENIAEAREQGFARLPESEELLSYWLRFGAVIVDWKDDSKTTKMRRDFAPIAIQGEILMNPKNYSIATLIGKRCPISRKNCILTPSPWYESQFPENFDLILLAWEEKGQELLEL